MSSSPSRSVFARRTSGAIWLLLGLLAGVTNARASFVTFETGQVRPLALSPDGDRLFAINTPDNQLEIFDIGPSGLSHAGSVAVGMEPIAVAARTNSEVWVVNHLSDSVSVVDVGSTPPRVTRTLLVGDEPRDVVFAGSNRNRAFITTARRGQNVPDSVPPLLTTASTPRALVWAFDANNLGSSLAGEPLSIIELFGDTPRALAVSPDGNTVYATVFHSGNQTTTVTEGAVCDGGATAGSCNVVGVAMPGGLPAPNANVEGITGPETGLIVKFNTETGAWEDQLGRDWSNAVKFSLPDYDVFSINANGNPPQQVAGAASGVGTILFNIVTNPISGRLYVSNTEAVNEVRFEGPGVLGTTVNGHLHESRITVIDNSGVAARHLNKHIDYSVVPSPAGVKEKSLATPLGMAVTSDGATLYVAAFGSSKVGVFSTTEIENDTFVPDEGDQITVSGGGPTGLALDEERDRLYVLTRFDNSISTIDTMTGTEVDHVSLHNPEPNQVVDGRRFLYDATFTSSNGEASCSTCHVFGDFDSLAWDLGNPDDEVLNNPNPVKLDPFNLADEGFHPLKGPMTTQSLRGMANHGPMHWRGDRTGGNDPGGDPLDEDAAFKKFIVAFEGLLGRDAEIPAEDMQAFADFILEVTYPPNPIRALDNSFTADQQAGRDLYFGEITDGFANCNGCHTLDAEQGFFGSDGETTFEAEPQLIKVPHLRNMYQKVGMFGMPAIPFIRTGDNGQTGDQVRGFGFLHDGSVDTLFRFHRANVFTTNANEARRLEQFMLAFDSDLAPIVGQQVTLTSSNSSVVGDRIDLIIARAAAGECDVVVKGNLNGEQRGWYRTSSGTFQSDRANDAPVSDAQLRAQASTAGQERTYTCVPPDSGLRVGVDRDEDGFFDGDEVDAGSDPADPVSIPGGSAIQLVAGKKLLIKDNLADDESKRKVVALAKDGSIRIPLPGTASDPRCGSDSVGTVKATLTLLSAESGQTHVCDLPCQNWSLKGSEARPKGYTYKDPELDDGTAKTVVWQDGKLLKLVLQGRGPTILDYDLQTGVSQGEVDIELASGATKVCMSCGEFRGRDGSDGKKFLGKETTCAAPPSCPAL